MCRVKACSRRAEADSKARSRRCRRRAAQAPAAGIPASGHDQYSVHFAAARLRVLEKIIMNRTTRAASASSPKWREQNARPPRNDVVPRHRARGFDQVRPDSGIRRPPAGGRDARGTGRRGLISILMQRRNALTKQYARLFDMEGVELDFREDALRSGAQAMQRKTGRSGSTHYTGECCCWIPCTTCLVAQCSEVVVDEQVIEGHNKPTSSTGPKRLAGGSVEEQRRLRARTISEPA